MILDSASKSIQFNIEAAATTTAPYATASYGDINQTSQATSTLYENDAPASGTTPVTLVSAPASGTARSVVKMSFYNADTVSHTFTVQLLDGASARTQIVQILTAGQSLFYRSDGSWSVGASGGTGPTGATGPAGLMGFPGFDGLDADDPILIPGPMGPMGPQGIIGFPGFDGEEGPEGMPVPGPIGATGAAGSTGSQGFTGSPGQDGLDGDDGQPPFANLTASSLAPGPTVGQGLQVGPGGLMAWLANPALNVKAYGAKGNGVYLTDGAITSGLSALTSASYTFVATDVGKVAVVQGAAAAGAQLHATISSVAAGAANLSATAGTTVTAAQVNFGTDDTTAIQSAINAGQTNWYPIGGTNQQSGARIYFPAGRYLVSSQLTVTGDNIMLFGDGPGFSEDFGNVFATNYAVDSASTLVWIGTASTTGILQAIPRQTLGTSGTPLNGFCLERLAFDCRNGDQNNGAFGVQLISCHGFRLSDIFAMDPLTTGFDFNVLPATTTNASFALPLSAGSITSVANGASGTGPAFPANSGGSGTIIVTAGTGSTTPGQQVVVTYTGGTATTFTGCTASGSGTFAVGSTIQILPGAQDCTRGYLGRFGARVLETSGWGLRFDGNLAGLANACINLVQAGSIAYGNGGGVDCINSDTNTFDTVICNRSGTGVGFQMGAATTAAGASRNNVLINCSAGAGGLTCATNTFPSGPTYIYNYQLANGEPVPTVGAGAILIGNYNGGAGGPLTGSSPGVSPISMAASTTTIIQSLKLPPQGIQNGLFARLLFNMAKTNAGTATWIMGVKIGATGTASDATVNSFTFTPTAVVDTGEFTLNFAINATPSASTSSVMNIFLKHQVTAVGFSTVLGTTNVNLGTPVNFNALTSGFLFLTVFVTTGAADVFNVVAPVPPIEILSSGNS